MGNKKAFRLLWAAVSVSLPWAAHGQTSGTWVNPDASSWSIGSNWSSDPLFPGAGGVASFAGFVGSDVTETPIVVDVPIELSALRLNTLSRVFLTGGQITFTGPAELNVTASPVYTIDSPSQPGVLFRPDDGHLIASVIAGSNGLVKTGGGMVRLTATNTFTGGLTINGGTVVASNAALGDAAGGVTLNGGSLRIAPDSDPINRSLVLTVAGGSLNMQGNTWGGVISGSGPLTIVLPAQNPFLPPVPGPAFTGHNTFTGALNVIGGANAQALRLKDADGAFDTPNIELNGGWIDLDNSGAANSNRLSDSAEVSINGGTINLIANAITPVNEHFGTLTLRGGTSHVTVQDAADAITVSAIQRSNRGVGAFSGRVFAGNGASLLVGGGGAAGSTNMSIIPFAVGGGDVYTYEAATGIRPLAPDEYVSTLPPGGSVTTDNVRLESDAVVSSAVTINSLSFANANNIISGSGTITITSGLLTSGPGANIVLAAIDFGAAEGIVSAPPFSIGSMPISGPISGSGGLTIGDGGAELSSLSSNYTGITTVNGLLRLSENVPASGIGPLGASTSAVVLVGAGAEIFNSGVQGIFARDLLVKSVGATDHSAVATITNMNITGDVQLDQWVRATGTIAGDVSGPGGINIAATAGLLRLSGNNTFTGGIEVGAGRLNIAGDNATGTGVIYLGGTRGGSTAGRLAAIDAPRTISNRVVVTGPINFNVGTFPLTMAGEFDLNGNLGTTSNYSIVGPPGSASDRIPTISGSVVNGVLFLNGGWLRLTGDNRQGATRVSGNTTLLRVESDHGLGSAPHSTTLAGGTLQLSGGISIPSHPLNLSGRLQSVAGNNTWNGNVNLTGTGLIQVDADTLTIGGSVSSTGSQLLTAGVGTLVAANYRLGSMFSVIAGLARVAPNGTDSGTSKVTALSIDSNARLDLTDNDLVIDYGVSSPAATVRQMLQDGRLFSSLADSTFRLGYRDNNIPANIVSTFSGLPVDASSLLIKYTYAGDTNLDGAVDVTDLGNLATGWNHASLWYTGDFNYDGITNVADLKLLAANWQLGAPASALGLSLDTLLAAFSLPPVEVPEPGALAAVGLVFAAFAGRRRFRSASPARGNQ